MTLRVKRTLNRRNPRKGFTLIELLVVIAIIGILAAVVLVSLNSARARGRDARRISDLQSVSLAMELYADANNSQYPAPGVADVLDNAAYVDIAGTLGTDNYLPSTPVDPVAARLYVADVTAAQTTYAVGADLEQDNPACATDYDGLGAAGAFAAACDDTGTGANACAGDEADATADFCICTGPDCNP